MDHLAYRHALTERLAGAELPFAAEEFDRRLARTRDAMQRQGLDALLLCQPSDIFYLCGYHTFEVSVHAALVVTTRRTMLQVASIETGPAVVTARVDEIVGYRWEAPEEIIDPLAQVLSECRAIGVDGHNPGLRHSVMQHLQGRLGGDRFQHAAGPLMATLRLVKSDAEIDCLVRSAAMTAEGLERAIEAVEPGRQRQSHRRRWRPGHAGGWQRVFQPGAYRDHWPAQRYDSCQPSASPRSPGGCGLSGVWRGLAPLYRPHHAHRGDR